MQFAILTAVLATLAASQSEGPPVTGLAWRLVLTGLATLSAPMFAFAGTSRLALRMPVADERERDLSRLQSLVTGLWLGAVLILLFVARWPRIVQANWALSALPLVDDLAILAPVVGSLLLIWTAFFRLEHHDRAVLGVLLRGGKPLSLARHLWFNTRHYLGLVLGPPLVVITVFDLLAVFRLQTGPLNDAWWVAIPLLAVTLLLMPLAVRRIWPTVSLPAGPLRKTLEATFRDCRCPVRDILLWNTDGAMANAAVVGFSRHLRYVLLSDVLLRRLSTAEVAAVMRHEIAHLRRWHLPLRLGLFLLPLALWQAARHCYPEFFAAANLQVEQATALPSALNSVAAPAVMLLYALIVVGRFSRFLEFDADMAACQDEQGRIQPQLAADFRSALVAVCDGAHESWLSQWLHPPLESRLALIDRALVEGRRPRAVEHRLHAAAVSLAGAYLACALAFVF